ncbi:hypothetical protein H2248_011694 [Termitomyces sp. 'cryptogamus']|nr:hypothetical protein H2248_011694 [Termitomyces sp. 'cryptogamus']
MDTKWLFYVSLGAIADALDLVLTYVMPEKRPQTSMDSQSDLDHLSDDALLDVLCDAPRLFPSGYRCPDIRKTTPNTVVKRCIDVEIDGPNADAIEANVLNLLFAETTIPVPRVRRVLFDGGYFWIFMDYIPGQTLAQAWPTLSTWKKICIAFTLRRYVRQLRGLKASATTPPGPPSIQGPRFCESPMFGTVLSHRGPFASYTELSGFFNERHQVAERLIGTPEDDPHRKEHFDDSEPLVLTHQDLNLRNMIIDKDGRLWIIDWAWAGYYPVWFEYTTMQFQNKMEHISGTNDLFWKQLIPFICGPYFKQERWWKRIARSLYVYVH